MKRMKYFLVAICLLFSAMVLSPVALASNFPFPNVFLSCPNCKEGAVFYPVSLSLPTANESGAFVLECSSCSNFLTYKIKFVGDITDVSNSSLERYDVFSFDCEFSGKPEFGMFISLFPPTCEKSGGFSYYHLGDCDVSQSFYSLPAAHNWSETKCTDPTCTTPGSIVSTCSRCGDTTTEVLPALGHDYSVSARTDPTCTIPGSIVSTCSRCNDTITEELPVSYHSWDVVEMVPSVYDGDGSIITEGYTFYTCSTCGSHYTAVAGASPPAVGLVTDVLGGEGMPDTTAALGKTFLSGLWSLFGITVPGFNFTFGQMWLGVLLASVSILVIRMIFGFGGGPRGESPRTSSTSNPRISKERRRDEY